MEKSKTNTSPARQHPEIKGWGIDKDPKNDPTYPLKKRTDVEQKGYSWERPPQQPVNIEVLRSIERPNITAVFGNSAPPNGLSGRLRRFAFKYGEGSYAHWFPLIMADRVNEVEGIVDDLRHGHLPNIFAEKGYKAQWKYNRESVVKKLVIGAAISVAGISLLLSKAKSRKA